MSRMDFTFTYWQHFVIKENELFSSLDHDPLQYECAKCQYPTFAQNKSVHRMARLKRISTWLHVDDIDQLSKLARSDDLGQLLGIRGVPQDF